MEDVSSQALFRNLDNTNPDRETRKHWIDLAKKFNVPIRCALFTASTELARHNDTVRALAGLIEVNATVEDCVYS